MTEANTGEQLDDDGLKDLPDDLSQAENPFDSILKPKRELNTKEVRLLGLDGKIRRGDEPNQTLARGEILPLAEDPNLVLHDIDERKRLAVESQLSILKTADGMAMYGSTVAQRLGLSLEEVQRIMDDQKRRAVE